MLPLLLDEHLRGRIYEILERLNEAEGWPLDLAVIGDHPELPLGTLDPAIIACAETERRILVTADKHIGAHIKAHQQLGNHTAGVIILTSSPVAGDVRPLFEYLYLVSEAMEAAEWIDQIEFYP